jgi:RNA polymerase sigma factor (sigma-70 family)
MSLNYLRLFEDWEIAIAKKLVNHFIEKHTIGKHACFQKYEFNDLLQECLTHWWFIRERYDPGRHASKKTFMGLVIRNKLKDLVQERQANKRKVAYFVESFDARVGSEKDSPTLLEDLEERHPEDISHDPTMEIESRVDVSKALCRLTTRQKEICVLLGKGRSIQDVGECLNTPRSTIYDEVERIKAIFLKEGLGEYLE